VLDRRKVQRPVGLRDGRRSRGAPRIPPLARHVRRGGGHLTAPPAHPHQDSPGAFPDAGVSSGVGKSGGGRKRPAGGPRNAPPARRGGNSVPSPVCSDLSQIGRKVAQDAGTWPDTAPSHCLCLRMVDGAVICGAPIFRQSFSSLESHIPREHHAVGRSKYTEVTKQARGQNRRRSLPSRSHATESRAQTRYLGIHDQKQCEAGGSRVQSPSRHKWAVGHRERSSLAECPSPHEQNHEAW